MDSSRLQPTRPYLPKEICLQMSALDEVAEQFLIQVNLAYFGKYCTGYQILSTDEWNAFHPAVEQAANHRHDLKPLGNLDWCRDHMRLLQACQKLAQLPSHDEDGDILMAGKYVLPVAVEMTEIAFIYRSLTQRTAHIIDALKSAGFSSVPRRTPAP